MTQVAGVSVETKARTSCAGVPTRIATLDHGPSLPSLFRNQRASSDTPILLYTRQYWLGVMDIGAGTTVARGKRVEVTDTAKLERTSHEIIRCPCVAMIKTQRQSSFRQSQRLQRARRYQWQSSSSDVEAVKSIAAPRSSQSSVLTRPSLGTNPIF